MKDKRKAHLVALTGAGISAESGLKTFRDSDGLWEGYRIEDVATPEAWHRNPAMVLDFYNYRRKAALEAKPNLAHQMLASLEAYFDVSIITQNVDDLHERAGSSNILHLHGKLNESRSSAYPELVYPIPGATLNMGDVCEKGFQLRPNIVWFGEDVPNIEPAASLVARADIFVIIGTSLQVYPAAGLVRFFDPQKPLFVIDPKPMPFIRSSAIEHIEMTAVSGLPVLKEKLLKTIALNSPE